MQKKTEKESGQKNGREVVLRQEEKKGDSSLFAVMGNREQRGQAIELEALCARSPRTRESGIPFLVFG